VHGRIAGKLKSKVEESTHIRPDMEAAIVPFAQREMVDTFMTGVDPKYSAAVNGFLDEILAIYPETILTTLPGLGDSEKESFLQKWKQIRAESLAGFKREME